MNAQNAHATAPVILLGMHRSGTTMIAELLDRLGLFLGDELESNHEAVYFLGVDDELFSRCNASWDQPAPMVRFFEHPEAVELSRAAVAADLESKNFKSFVGWKQHLKRGGASGLDRPWGFKDPRVVFTLPLWISLFPNAKLVAVQRNGIDVANSLLTREKKRLAHQVEVFERRMERRAPHRRLARAAYKGSPRCLSFEGAFGLWEEYVERLEQVLATSTRPTFTVRYEDFVASPREPLAALAHFCGLTKFSPADFDAALIEVDSSRGNAFKQSKPSPEVAKALASPWMKTLGYAR
ncbi:MAG: sulfotransferase [Planctomycetes bacterium]|nr:sulfotransferase [Planctomycetota bacterium]